ncbi:hypothetical protein DSN94_01040 [Campylobacter upsaliensis]|uniref:Major antigenic peptide PEB2 n=2 Tax=Campylobacter TaxID=194 RepID=A0A5L8XMI3_CAMUP|nr:substrate-binding domain-containing protein [Campylobacter upsaliensis]EAH5216869.1 hypothetical protein [Campylobacter upsaliensis]EAH5847550.1 hypothetical protein [Campylobacter upsaliensis]EAH5878862.1 hypothetical protein [Campylobacter upsaliensis]EAH5976579.1 hypothetical protein [Campylobacter upsaliensis]EAI4338973.1 hypothetical protein [Campylobacter upsaliensis]
MMKKLLFLSTLMASLLSAEILLYGPDSAALAMREFALEFEKKSGERVVVNSGPSKTWLYKARQDADLFYAPSAKSMERYIKLAPNLSIDDISIIHLCQTNLMVRPNNPLKITSFNDLLDKKVKIMAMSGGHNSYEFIALKMGNGENLTKLRKNIIVYAKGPKEALSLWRQDPNIDVLIGSSCWKKTLENEALFVEVGKEFAMYKAMELAPTKKGLQNQKVQEFINFTKSEEGQRILQDTMWSLEGDFKRGRVHQPPLLPHHNRNHQYNTSY